MIKKEIKSVEEAFQVIEETKYRIPFDAIRYLREQPPSPPIKKKILFALVHAYDGTYYKKEEDYWYAAPLWYMVAAETHLEPDFMDPVIALFTTTDDDWDFISEQGAYLIGELTEKYPERMARKVMHAVDVCVDEGSEGPYVFLFEAFYYFDREKHDAWFLKTLEKTGLGKNSLCTMLLICKNDY